MRHECHSLSLTHSLTHHLIICLLYVLNQIKPYTHFPNSLSSLSVKMGGTRTRLFLLLVALTSLCIVQLTTADHHHHRHGYWNILKLNQKIKPVGEEEENSWGDSLKSYCESWRMNVEINNIRGFDVVPQECVSYIKKYMTSSQYSADSRRALEEATVYLSSCCSLQGDGKDAWIFDLDDTLLSTIPYFKKHSFGYAYLLFFVSIIIIKRI